MSHLSLISRYSMLGCFLLSGTFRLFNTSLLSDPLCKRTCGYGGIGRRARFRFWWDPPCRFKSCYPHYFDNHHRQQTRGSACCFFLFSAHPAQQRKAGSATQATQSSSASLLHLISTHFHNIDFSLIHSNTLWILTLDSADYTPF